jgi:hypothetical protein
MLTFTAWLAPSEIRRRTLFDVIAEFGVARAN